MDSGGKENMDPEEMNKIQESLKMADSSWKTRKKKCMNIVAQITSASGEKTGAFMVYDISLFSVLKSNAIAPQERVGLESDPS